MSALQLLHDPFSTDIQESVLDPCIFFFYKFHSCSIFCEIITTGIQWYLHKNLWQDLQSGKHDLLSTEG